MTKRRAAIATLCALLLASGCGRAPEPPTEGLDRRTLLERRALAKELEKRGELQAALMQWRILESFDDPDGKAAAAAEALETKIRKKAQSALESGVKARAQGRQQEARRQFLLVLRLDPANEKAKDRLQALEVGSIRRSRAKIIDSLVSMEKASKKRAQQAAASEQTKSAAAEVTSRKTEGPEETRVSVPEARELPPEPAGLAESAAGSDGEPASKMESAATVLEQTAYQVTDTEEALREFEALVEKSAYRESILRLEDHLAKHPKDERAYELLAISHRRIGLDLYESGNPIEALPHLKAFNKYASISKRDGKGLLTARPPQVRRDLAQESFEKGLRAFNEDLEQSIAHWVAALAYDPNHSKAKLFLDRAYKIKDKLQAVKN